MRASMWIVASALFFASGTAFAGPGLPLGHDDTVYPISNRSGSGSPGMATK